MKVVTPKSPVEKKRERQQYARKYYLDNRDKLKTASRDYYKKINNQPPDRPISIKQGKFLVSFD